MSYSYIALRGTCHRVHNFKLVDEKAIVHVVCLPAMANKLRPPSIRIEAQFDSYETGLAHGWHSNYWDSNKGDWAKFQLGDFDIEPELDEIFMPEDRMFLANRPIGKSWDHSPYTAFAP